jgi:hypothetical protein
VIPASWPYSQQTYEAFAAMKKAGFTAYCCGNRRAPHALVSAYDWVGYLDVINIRCADRVTAARLPIYDGLDIFAPTRAVWHYLGALEPTVAAMLKLSRLVVISVESATGPNRELLYAVGRPAFQNATAMPQP